MENITVNYTEAPWYHNPNRTNQFDKYFKNWEYGDLDHKVKPSVKKTKRVPLVFDVETTAKTPQKPILISAYDAKTKAMFVFFKQGYKSVNLDIPKLKKIVKEESDSYGVPVNAVEIRESISPSEIEIFYNIVSGNSSRVLVGHNIHFDLNICGTPNDGILDSANIGPEWESATEYKRFTLLGKRAGAYGRLYTLWNHRKMEPLKLKIADTRVAAKSLLLPGSLEGACNALDVKVNKDEGEQGHGNLSYDYVRYNIRDVFSTLLLYEELRSVLHEDFASNLSPENLYSTASIFKDVLKRMNYDRTHYPKEALDIIAPAYFGGRTEAALCGELIEDVTYTDILSEYPTVSELSNVWRFMRSRWVDWEQIDPSELPEISDVTELQNPDMWENCADYYVILESSGSVLPVRTQLTSSKTTRVYAAKVNHGNGQNTSHHYYDYIASTLLSENPPKIKAAFRITTGPEMELKETKVGDTIIKPKDNVLKRAIEERKRISVENPEMGWKEQAYKITANAGYGVAAERVVDKHVYGDTVERHDIAGTFTNLHVAATITAGGRLLLAFGEKIASKNGGKLYYCDTDSLILDSSVVDDVIEAFSPLNPYSGVAGDLPMLEIENGKDEKPLKNVDFFAVGEKKYCILRNDKIVKWTEHGLGHFDTMRGHEKSFWYSILWKSNIVENSEESFNTEMLEKPLIYQRPASTVQVRKAVSKLVGFELRYGDWIQTTVYNGSQKPIYFVGIDLESQVLKVSEDSVEIVNEVNGDYLKRVNDLLNEWWRNSLITTHRPEVLVIEKRAVTKESQTVSMDLDKMLQETLEMVDFSTLFGES